MSPEVVRCGPACRSVAVIMTERGLAWPHAGSLAPCLPRDIVSNASVRRPGPRCDGRSRVRPPTSPGRAGAAAHTADVATAGSAGAFLFARSIAWADPRSMPPPVRLSFGAFAIILIGAGVALLVHASIFPWRLGPETSVMFGLIFLGAATYFIYGALDPHWGNAVGQLAGFLAYDLVLLAPFFEHFSTAQGGSLVSLIIYVAFLVYSGTLASYYLFASKATRIRLAIVGSDSWPALAAGDADTR